jgi:hypothetical protein
LFVPVADASALAEELAVGDGAELAKNRAMSRLELLVLALSDLYVYDRYTSPISQASCGDAV